MKKIEQLKEKNNELVKVMLEGNEKGEQ